MTADSAPFTWEPLPKNPETKSVNYNSTPLQQFPRLPLPPEISTPSDTEIPADDLLPPAAPDPAVMCPDMGVCGHYCRPGTECFRTVHCGPLSGVFPHDEWPLRPSPPVPVAFMAEDDVQPWWTALAPAMPATAPMGPDVPADQLAEVPPAPLPHPPLYVIHTPYPEPPVYTWDVKTRQWVENHPLPIPGLTPRKAAHLNQSERPPLSLHGNDPVWDAGVSTDQEVVGVPEANILTSDVLGKPGVHKLVLDIDLPAKLVPTTTPGHWHLYIDHEMPWEAYVKVIDALAEAGVIEKGYARASKLRGYTSVRPPWLPKTEDEKSKGGGSG
jgi:hypothetical protein